MQDLGPHPDDVQPSRAGSPEAPPPLTAVPSDFDSQSSLSPQAPARTFPGRGLVVLLILGLFVGGLGGGVIGTALSSRSHPSVGNRTPAAATAAPSSAGAPAASPLPQSAIAAIYQQVSPGVVTIQTSAGSATPRSFSEATGTGIVVDSAGNILTNAHVVSGAQQVRVIFKDGSTTTGTVSGVDNSDDLAIVKVSASASQLHPLTLGNSDAVQVGDTALAIGTPFGLSESLTAGIISGLNRSATAPNGRALSGMIQTDAAINPGNSGGPLLNAAGAVIGVNESIQSPIQGNVGIGFAVPINTAKRLIPQLEQGIAIQHPWLGISAQSITPGSASSIGLSEQSGVLVVALVSGGPAEKAGLQASGNPDPSDDIITAIDGHAVTTVEQLTAYLDTKKVGDQVTLSITRGGRHSTVKVTLGNFQTSP
jgi:S1-C subfamily serine protease